MFILEPVRYFSEVIANSSGRLVFCRGMLPVGACAAVTGLGSATLLNKTVCGVPMAGSITLAAMEAAVAVLYFGLIVGIFALVDAVGVAFRASTVRSGWHLAGCLGLTYWAWFPFGVAMTVHIMMQEPAVGRPRYSELGALEALSIVERIAHEAIPYVSSIEMVDGYFSLWVVALQCCALRAVSRVGVGAAVGLGIALGVIFVVIPWAMARMGA